MADSEGAGAPERTGNVANLWWESGGAAAVGLAVERKPRRASSETTDPNRRPEARAMARATSATSGSSVIVVRIVM